MHPILFKLGPVPVHTYGFLIATGFLIALKVIRSLSVRSKLDPDKVLDLAFWCLAVGFLGARILFVITRFNYFMTNPLDIFKLWEGGLVFLGGPLVVVPFVVWYIRKHKLNLWSTLDVLTPGLVINHVLGRFGCLMAGCCYGKPTGTTFGIQLYSDLVAPDLRGLILHPTQLYEAVALFILFLGLLYVFKKKVFDGQVVLSYFLSYPIIRSVIEVYRGDLIRGFVIEGVLSTSQFISILVFLAAALVLAVRLKQVKASDEHMPELEKKTKKKRASK